MNINQRERAQEIELLLQQYTCTENLYKHPFNRTITYTDGVRAMAQECEAYWLIDAIMSYQTPKYRRRFKLDPNFQIWRLEREQEGNEATLIGESDTDNKEITQKILHTDFPLPSIKLYLENNILLLPSER